MKSDAETRQMRLETIKARIGRSEYRVDPDAVAEAIVRRLMSSRRELERTLHALDAPPPRAVPSGDVLKPG
jgi:cobalamin biosynthesis Mg chelatase CobN